MSNHNNENIKLHVNSFGGDRVHILCKTNNQIIKQNAERA